MRTATRMVVLNSKKYVLDLISAVVAAAYSLRRLYASYTGAAIRVRRSSDNAERDIGFIGEHLDLLALLVFVGNGSGFVTTWYDQSGNGRHATQTTAANQPQIVSNGAIITEGGRPLISFDGLTQFLNLPSSGAPTQNSSLIGVFQTTSAADKGAGFINIMADVVPEKHEIRLGVGTGGSQTFYRAYWNGAYVTIDNAAVNFQNLSVFNVSFVTSGGVITTTVRVNGSNALSASRAGTWGDTVKFTIGRFVRINTMRAGIAQELISIQSDLFTVDRQTLERNQGIYFNISVS
jgi:trimeric autotransporter adhesin